jgi:hypothetical protein
VHTRIQPKRTPTTPHCPYEGLSLQFSLAYDASLSLRYIHCLQWDLACQDLDVLEKRYNQLIISTWNIIKERSNYDRLGQEFWDRLNKLAPDQTHIFRRPVTPTP